MSVIDKAGFYRQRNGNKVEVVAVTRGVAIGYGETDEPWEPETWQLNGAWYEDSLSEHPRDITGPWIEEPPFRISDKGCGVYETRTGLEATVAKPSSDGRYDWEGFITLPDGSRVDNTDWRDDGCFNTDYPTNGNDLVCYLRPLDEEWNPTAELRMRSVNESVRGAHWVHANDGEEIGAMILVVLEQRWTSGDDSEWRAVPVDGK